MSMGENCIQLGSRMFSKRMLPFVCARLYSGEEKVVVAPWTGVPRLRGERPRIRSFTILHNSIGMACRVDELIEFLARCPGN